MATKRPLKSTTARRAPRPDTVAEFMQRLDHPLKAALARVRSLILGASPEVAEGIKWNSPSFYLRASGEYFATINIHRRTKAEDCVLVILHQGAKVKAHRTPGPAIRDPRSLLEWLGRDRAAAKFHDLKAVKAHQAAFQDAVRQWIACM